MPHGIDQVKGVMGGVGNKPRVKQTKDRLVVTPNMDRTRGHIMQAADDSGQEENSIDAREFTAVGVPFFDGTWDTVHGSDGISIRGTNHDKGSSTAFIFQGSITNSIALEGGDSSGNGSSSIWSINKFQGPLFVGGEGHDEFSQITSWRCWGRTKVGAQVQKFGPQSGARGGGTDGICREGGSGGGRGAELGPPVHNLKGGPNVPLVWVYSLVEAVFSCRVPPFPDCVRVR